MKILGSLFLSFLGITQANAQNSQEVIVDERINLEAQENLQLKETIVENATSIELVDGKIVIKFFEPNKETNDLLEELKARGVVYASESRDGGLCHGKCRTK